MIRLAGLILLIFLLVNLSAEAYESGPSKFPYLAAGLSLILAGTGQMYNEEYYKGFPMLGIEVVSLLVIYAAREDDRVLYGATVDVDNDNAVGTIGWIIFLANKFFTQKDAYDSAIRINKKRGSFSNVRVSPIKRGISLSIAF